MQRFTVNCDCRKNHCPKNTLPYPSNRHCFHIYNKCQRILALIVSPKRMLPTLEKQLLMAFFNMFSPCGD